MLLENCQKFDIHFRTVAHKCQNTIQITKHISLSTTHFKTKNDATIIRNTNNHNTFLNSKYNSIIVHSNIHTHFNSFSNILTDTKTRNNTKLDQTPFHKLLGVHLHQDLNFDEHVDSVCNKLLKRIGLLRSIKHLLSRNVSRIFSK